MTGATGKADFEETMAKGERVFLLPPQITFESASTEKILPIDAENKTQINIIMTSTAFEELHKAGFQVLTQDSLKSDSEFVSGTIIQRLTEEARVLTSQTKDKSPLLPLLNQLADISGANILCVHTVRAKIGSGATYNSQTGSMAQGTNSSAIKVILLFLENGDMLWRNEAFVRDEPSSRNFRKAVKMLFKISK
ncbi:MAG: hypothetical protein JXA91_01920 [Candidatus Thermoplasmatota archaeon]|nr:hypothetical protein [Candidatus Thermoplasmatota archaeon]